MRNPGTVCVIVSDIICHQQVKLTLKMLQIKYLLRLPNMRGQLWISNGNVSRCIGQLALMVNLADEVRVSTW